MYHSTLETILRHFITALRSNLQNIPIEEAFENLRCSKEGLSAESAQRRLELFGYNKLKEKKGKTPDWQDFRGIITLLVINSTISFIEENNAGNAATAALMARLAPKAKSIFKVFLAVVGVQVPVSFKCRTMDIEGYANEGFRDVEHFGVSMAFVSLLEGVFQLNG
ncbi:hypothetical protein Vadar_031194 [Vaccinium darrowii]|uniref:Uncharacterized protein n=1 Tax=Vaccinium darrowii TaxID=229202 RepID=A0ACB7ZNS8_9ERIC|nr:hypothetical protein Vadar_031194 [Vaccinium darrowii]